MKLGFTGSREGMTDEQKETVRRLLHELKPSEVHHGDCIGADAQFAELSAFWIESDIGVRRRPVVVAHPSNIAGTCAHTSPDLRYPRKPPLERNRDIVGLSDRLIAAPKSNQEEQRSGTWATIRYALKTATPVTIVWPDGKIEPF